MKKNMDSKYAIAMLCASGIVLGIVASAAVGIGVLHLSQKEAQATALAMEAATLEANQSDPLWILADENVALAATVLELALETEQLTGYAYVANQVQIAVDCPAGDILPGLGEPLAVQEAGNSMYGSLDKHYQYQGFEVSTYELGDTDYISAVFIDDENSMTPEGVSVSMTKEDMEAVYGMEYTEEAGICTYEKDGMGLEFMIDDGKIVYIQYLSSNYM